MTPTELTLATSLRSQGHSYRAIGREVHYTWNHVRACLLAHGVVHGTWAQARARDDEAARLRDAGVSLGEIARRCGYKDAKYVYSTLRRRGGAMQIDTVAVVSGGLDSVTMAYYLHARGKRLHLLGFDYGQRHVKELAFAQQCARDLNVGINIVDVRALAHLLSGSALTGDAVVPDGHYAEESMRVTVVPNRNAILLSIAYGVAVSKGARYVAIGVHGGDHFIYPDCRKAFLDAFRQMENMANDGLARVGLLHPFLHGTKTSIAHAAGLCNVPIAATWSCYKGGARHCGRCGTCVERREALRDAVVPDPTEYEDMTFAWTKV